MKKLVLAAALAIGVSSPLAAQSAGFDPSGWRPADDQEKALRKVWEEAKEGGPSDTSKNAKYDCMLAWAVLGNAFEGTGDVLPTIAGDLSPAFTYGYLSHYANVLIREDPESEVFIANSRAAFDRVMAKNLFANFGETIEYFGSCYVQPASWWIDSDFKWTSGEFLGAISETDIPKVYADYVVDREARDRFDELVLSKQFADAANYAAQLHGNQRTKSTVYWHEVLELSAIAVANGELTSLSTPLLETLSQVWWPRYRRRWAECALQVKAGGDCGGRFEYNSPPPGSEPQWVTNERNLQRRNMLNYTPCNTWNRSGCITNRADRMSIWCNWLPMSGYSAATVLKRWSQ